MNIRPVCSTDRKEVLDILAKTMGSEYLDEMVAEFEKSVGGEYLGLVAEEDRIFGYLCVRKVVDTYKLETIAVASDAQGRGVGTVLVDETCRILKGIGASVLNVDTNSADAIKFYLTNGFSVSGMVEDEYIPGIAQVHLTRKFE